MTGSASSIEIANILISLATPVTMAVIGYVLDRRLKSIDDAQWQNRKIIEKRLDLYDEIAPDLNMVFCFCRFVGSWKEISPKQMLETKRKLDRHVNIYRHLLSEDFFKSYETFIKMTFRTYTGHGKDALIRSTITNHWGDRRAHATYSWEPDYDEFFDTSNIPKDEEIKETYLKAMAALRDCIRLKSE